MLGFFSFKLGLEAVVFFLGLLDFPVFDAFMLGICLGKYLSRLSFQLHP